MLNNTLSEDYVEVRDDVQVAYKVPDSLASISDNLLLCRKTVMRPYYILLSIIGYRAWGRDRLRFPRLYMILDYVYPILILFFLVLSYVCDAAKCAVATPLDGLLNSSSAAWHGEMFHCKSMINLDIIPVVLHLTAYLIGLVDFRVYNNEGFYSLMEKTFILSHNSHRITKKLRAFLTFGALMMFIGVLIDVQRCVLIQLPGLVYTDPKNRTVFCVLLAVIFVTSVLQDALLYAVVMTYVTQSQLVIESMCSLQQSILEKSVDLKSAMKTILDVKQNISRINSLLSVIITLICIISAIHIVHGVFFLVAVKDSTALEKIWTVQVVLFHTVLVAVPIVQAARITSMGNSVVQSSLSAAVYGYPGTDCYELGNFLVFMSTLGFKAKMCTVPVSACCAWLILGAILTLALVYLQILVVLH